MTPPDQSTLRALYINTWQKSKTQALLTPLESQIAQVISEHPEYHMRLKPEHLNAQYFPELQQTNPFLHMGLHLALREQVATDRPAGIHAIFKTLLGKTQDPLQAEHQMMDALIEALWHAQRNNTLPDEGAYVKALQALIIQGQGQAQRVTQALT